MYYLLIQQAAQSLEHVLGWLDKAERHAGDRKFDVGVLLNGRLAPDMKPLIYQVQSASDYVKAGAAWLSGQKPPAYEDNEQTIDELRERIRKTVEFVRGIPEAQFADAPSQKIRLSWEPGKVMTGQDYLTEMTIPNVYFHILMVYSILRQGGVDVGKMDFLGSLTLVEG